MSRTFPLSFAYRHPGEPRRLSPCVVEARASARGHALLLDTLFDAEGVLDHARTRARAFVTVGGAA